MTKNIYSYMTNTTINGRDFRQWLLAVRRNEIPKEEILLRNRELRNNAIEVAGNFVGKEDVRVLNRVVKDMNETLGTHVQNIKVQSNNDFGVAGRQ